MLALAAGPILKLTATRSSRTTPERGYVVRTEEHPNGSWVCSVLYLALPRRCALVHPGICGVSGPSLLPPAARWIEITRAEH